jgi:hypothetical protein
MEYDRTRDFDKYPRLAWQVPPEQRGARLQELARRGVRDDARMRSSGSAPTSASASTRRAWCAATSTAARSSSTSRLTGWASRSTTCPSCSCGVPDAEKWWTTADSSRPETISYLRNHGFPRIRSAIKGARSVEEGVEFLKSYDIVVHPRCQHLIDELTLYSYKLDKLTGQVTPVLADKDNHMIDALRYAVEGVRRIQPDKRTIPQSASRGWRRRSIGDLGMPRCGSSPDRRRSTTSACRGPAPKASRCRSSSTPADRRRSRRGRLVAEGECGIEAFREFAMSPALLALNCSNAAPEPNALSSGRHGAG